MPTSLPDFGSDCWGKPSGGQHCNSSSALSEVVCFYPEWVEAATRSKGRRALDINSGPGRLLIALGFFAFVAFVVALLILGLKAQSEYRRGLSNINPLGWTAAGFLMLLALSLVRTCENGPPTY